MAYSAVLIVWACECLAFIRFYHWWVQQFSFWIFSILTRILSLSICQHRDYLRREEVPHVQRWSEEDGSEYPYRSRWQPYTAYFALLGCIFVSLVANGAALWNGFHLLPFLASYLTVRKDFELRVIRVTKTDQVLLSKVIVFVGLWVLLKFMRGAKWSLVDLSQPEKAKRIFNDLQDIRLSVTQSD